MGSLWGQPAQDELAKGPKADLELWIPAKAAEAPRLRIESSLQEFSGGEAREAETDSGLSEQTLDNYPTSGGRMTVVNTNALKL